MKFVNRPISIIGCSFMGLVPYLIIHPFKWLFAPHKSIPVACDGAPNRTVYHFAYFPRIAKDESYFYWMQNVYTIYTSKYSLSERCYYWHNEYSFEKEGE